MAASLRQDGYRVDTAPNGQKALGLAKSTASVIIITACATVDTSIQAMQGGGQEYIVKPYNPQEIHILVSHIMKFKKLQSENAILRKKIRCHYCHRDIMTKNPRMEEILALTQEVAILRSTVLIRGESGTGKELAARAIHFSGNRSDKPFIVVSCAAVAISVRGV